MATLHIVYNGPPEQRHAIKVTAMQPLAAVLKDLCPKLRPAVDPSTCTVTLNKKPVDVSVPFRFSNVPTGSTLVISRVEAAPSSKPAEQPEASTAPGAAAAAAAAAPSASSAPAAATQAAAAAQASAGDAAAGPAPTWSLMGMDREVVVYTHEALQAMTAAAAAAGPSGRADASAGGADELPDDFYEMTTEDYAALMKGNDSRRKEEAGFRTKASREAAERARAEAFGPIPVRVHLPDNVIMQAAFAATETLQKLQDLVSKALLPQLSKAFYLYTTPPKQVLKDLDQSLYKAGLVPAAHVYVHVDEKKAPSVSAAGPFLRPELQATLQTQLAPGQALPGQAPAQQADDAAAASEAAAAAAEREQARSAGVAVAQAAQAQPQAVRTTAAGSKVPKWLKMGK